MRPGESAQARDGRLQELLKLFLVGKSGERLESIKRRSQHSTDLEPFDRNLFYRLFHAQPFINRKIDRHTANSVGELPPEETSPYWRQMAAVTLSNYPPATRHEYVENLAISISALRTWARRHGPAWLIEYLEKRTGSIGSVVDDCHGWLQREIGRAHRSGQKLKRSEIFEAMHENFSRLTKREREKLWAEVPEHQKFAGRPSQDDRHT